MRDSRGRSPDPRLMSDLIDQIKSDLAPATQLAQIQMIWDELVGERVSAVTEVVKEKDGLITVECKSSVWAQELQMMGPRITRKINERLDAKAPLELRFVASS